MNLSKRKVKPFLVAVALFLSLFCGVRGVFAQQNIADSTILLSMLQVSYGGYLPQADMGKRFGYTNFIGVEFGPKFKSNIYLTGGGYFIFGDVVHENQLFASTSYNLVITDPSTGRTDQYAGWLDRDGFDFVPTLNLRGFAASLRLGYIFKQFRPPKLNPNSGPFVEIGIQGIQHSIGISAPDNAPYLAGDYRKGYDRLTRGVGSLFSVGFRVFSSSRFINGYVAFDYQHNFTQTLRYNLDERRYDDRIRNDILLGFRVGWCFPVYRQAASDFYY